MTSSDVLAKLFGSSNRVKIIRLFLLNPEKVFESKNIFSRAKVSRQAGRREILLLKNIGFIKAKSAWIEIKNKKVKVKKLWKKEKLRRPLKAGSESRPRRASGKRIFGWALNESFPLIIGLKNFILDSGCLSRDKLLKKLYKAGRMKLVILSGIFGEENSGTNRIDILVVGDVIKKGILERVIREIESEVGKELVYAAFNTQDFLYRLGMYDKFIRDILDYPHEKILNKLGV